MQRIATSLAVAAAVAAVAVAAPPEPVRRQRLTLLHTSDVHGAVLPVDDLTGQPAGGCLAQVATLVEGVRREATNPVLVLDSGDAIQGTPLEQFGHVEWGEPSPTIAAMNRIGYQAMAIGNHEFNYGLEVLGRAERQATFPFLAANVLEEESGRLPFRPYVVLEAGGLRVGVLGLVTPNIPGWEQPEHYRGLVFDAMDSAARRWVEELEGRSDLVVVLAHTGFERSPEDGSEVASADPGEDYAWRLAQVEGVDVLLTGHTHRSTPPRRLGAAIVSQPGSRGRYVTRIDLELEQHQGVWRVVSFAGDNLPTRDLAPDAAVVAATEDLRARVAAVLDRRAGTATAPLSVGGCRLADCAALDLVHAAQLDASAADLSLAAILSDRTPDLPAGPVTWRWVHSLYVYPNALVVLRLDGRQVKEVLEHAALYYDGLECAVPGGGCRLASDPRIPHYNVDSMQGVSYRVDPTRDEGDRIRDLRYRGRPVAPDQGFTLALNSYRASGGGGYPHLAAAPVVWRSSVPVTDLIADFLARHDPFEPLADGNWRVAPDLVGERPLAPSLVPD